MNLQIKRVILQRHRRGKRPRDPVSCAGRGINTVARQGARGVILSRSVSLSHSYHCFNYGVDFSWRENKGALGIDQGDITQHFLPLLSDAFGGITEKLRKLLIT